MADTKGKDPKQSGERIRYRETEQGAVPVLYCDRQKRWLPVEEHAECEYCAAQVYDENGDPVSFICTHSGERREFQPDYEDRAEDGRGAPNPPLDPDLLPDRE